MILTHGSPLSQVRSAVFTRTPPTVTLSRGSGGRLRWTQAHTSPTLSLARKGKSDTSTEHIPQPGELQRHQLHLLSLPQPPTPSHSHTHIHTHTHSPICWGLTLSWPHQASTGLGREGHLVSVSGRSLVGWCWAHLKASQTFGQCVFLRTLVTKDGPLPPGGHRDHVLCLPGCWILSFPQAACPVSPSHQGLAALRGSSKVST